MRLELDRSEDEKAVALREIEELRWQLAIATAKHVRSPTSGQVSASRSNLRSSLPSVQEEEWAESAVAGISSNPGRLCRQVTARSAGSNPFDVAGSTTQRLRASNPFEEEEEENLEWQTLDGRHLQSEDAAAGANETLLCLAPPARHQLSALVFFRRLKPPCTSEHVLSFSFYSSCSSLTTCGFRRDAGRVWSRQQMLSEVWRRSLDS